MARCADIDERQITECMHKSEACHLLLGAEDMAPPAGYSMRNSTLLA